MKKITMLVLSFVLMVPAVAQAALYEADSREVQVDSVIGRAQLKRAAAGLSDDDRANLDPNGELGLVLSAAIDNETPEFTPDPDPIIEIEVPVDAGVVEPVEPICD